MNQQQINWLKSFPNAEQDGTLMNILLRDDLATIPFENIAKVLIQTLYADKQTLKEENRKLTKIAKDAGVYYKILEEN